MMKRRGSAPIDDTLDELMNARKLKPLRLNADDPDEPLGSPLVAQRKQVMQHLANRSAKTRANASPEQDQDDDDDLPPEDDDDNGGDDGEEGEEGAEGDDDDDDDGEEGAGQGGASSGLEYVPRKVVDPIEQEMQRAIRKAKLLARITQLAKRGVRPTKTPSWRASEQELMIEVARMEVIAARSVRIDQGRAALLMSVGAGETGMNLVDKKLLQESDYKIGMNGYSEHLWGEIGNYDDVLEHGMDSVMGPPGEGYWWRELGFMLASSMAMYRINKGKARTDEDDRRAVMEELKQSPEFRSAIAKEIVDEMRRKQAEDAKAQQEQQKVQRLGEQLQQAMHPQPQQAPQAQAHVGRMKPPPAVMRTGAATVSAAREDIAPVAAQTQAMVAEFGLTTAAAAAGPQATATAAAAAITNQTLALSAKTKRHKDGGLIIESGV